MTDVRKTIQTQRQAAIAPNMPTRDAAFDLVATMPADFIHYGRDDRNGSSNPVRVSGQQNFWLGGSALFSGEVMRLLTRLSCHFSSRTYWALIYV